MKIGFPYWYTMTVRSSILHITNILSADLHFVLTPSSSSFPPVCFCRRCQQEFRTAARSPARPPRTWNWATSWRRACRGHTSSTSRTGKTEKRAEDKSIQETSERITKQRFLNKKTCFKWVLKRYELPKTNTNFLWTHPAHFVGVVLKAADRLIMAEKCEHGWITNAVQQEVAPQCCFLSAGSLALLLLQY